MFCVILETDISQGADSIWTWYLSICKSLDLRRSYLWHKFSTEVAGAPGAALMRHHSGHRVGK